MQRTLSRLIPGEIKANNHNTPHSQMYEEEGEKGTELNRKNPKGSEGKKPFRKKCQEAEERCLSTCQVTRQVKPIIGGDRRKPDLKHKTNLIGQPSEISNGGRLKPRHFIIIITISPW